MKLKEFKQFINQIDSKYNELEVVMPYFRGNYGMLVSDFLAFRNVICLSGDYKNNIPLEEELRKLEI